VTAPGETAAATPGQAQLAALVDGHFFSDGPNPMQLVCMTEDDSDVECDTWVSDVEPGITWNELERRMAEHAREHHFTAAIVAAPAAPQPAPDLDAAFAGGMRVRTAPCTADAHDGEHFQVRTNGHWLCAHLLASMLIAQGIVADPEAQPAPELEPIIVSPGDGTPIGGLLAHVMGPQSAPEPGPDVCECGHYWAHHAFGDDVCAVVDCPCTRPRPAQPAPELAAAMRETRELRQEIARVAVSLRVSGFLSPGDCDKIRKRLEALAGPEPHVRAAGLRDGIEQLANDLGISANATRPSRKSSIEDEIAIALRKLLETP
jgi:hypothetical protein